MDPHRQKLAEKLSILNDRGNGMLVRIYNIKKVLYYYISQLFTQKSEYNLFFMHTKGYCKYFLTWLKSDIVIVAWYSSGSLCSIDLQKHFIVYL